MLYKAPEISIPGTSGLLSYDRKFHYIFEFARPILNE